MAHPNYKSIFLLHLLLHQHPIFGRFKWELGGCSMPTLASLGTTVLCSVGQVAWLASFLFPVEAVLTLSFLRLC